MLTFQDFEKEADRATFIYKAIQEHMGSPMCKTARDADLYDRQRT